MKKKLLFVAVIFLTVTALHAQLQFQPATIDFGQKPITSTSTLEVIITSQINQLISLSDLPAPFSASPDEFMIAIGEQKTITITFHPMTAGSFAQTLTATGSIWGTAQLEVYGQSGEATVSFSGSSLDMGTIIITGHSQQMITVQSDIAQMVTLSNLPSLFSFNPPTVDLLPNEPSQVFVSFDPQLPGYYGSYLTATGNISGYAEMYVYGLANEASINTYPQSLNFEPLFSGQTDTLEMIVTTDINQDISLSGLSGVFSVFPENLTLVAGEAQSVFVSFAPVNPGNFSQSLYLAGSIWGGIYIPVYGECIDPQISVSPAQVDFGTVALLSSSTQYVTVYNTGNGALECELANSNAHFTVSPGVFSVSQGSSQSVAITFVPDFVPAEYDTLLVTSNDPDTPLVKVPLQGQGMSQVSGEVCGTWYKANSPYNFTGSVTVPESCTLTIEPGVVVNMASYDLNVYGKLVCNGLLNDSIRFNGSSAIQLSSTFAANDFDYVVLDRPSGSNGLTINSHGLSIKNSNLKNYNISNSNKSSVMFDDFNDWNFQDIWSETNSELGNTQVYAYWYYSPFLLITSSNNGNDYGVVSKPIIVVTPGKISLSLDFRISNSYPNCNTQFLYRVNKGNWIAFFESNYNYAMDWNNYSTIMNYNFQISDTLELMILNHVNGNFSNNQETLIDNVKFNYLNSSLQISNSKLNLTSIDNYVTDFDTVSSLHIDNSTLDLTENIENHNNYSSIEIIKTKITKAGYNAIHLNGAYSRIYLDNVAIENVNGVAVSPYADYSTLILKNTSIKNCSSDGINIPGHHSTIFIDSTLISTCYHGITINSTYSTCEISNSIIENNSSAGILNAKYHTSIKITKSEIINNNDFGIRNYSDGTFTELIQSNISGNTNTGIYLDNAQTVNIKGSIVSNNGGTGLYGYSCEVLAENSIITANQEYGIYSKSLYGNFLSCVFNQNKGISTWEKSYVFNSIVSLNNQNGSQFSGDYDFSYSKISGDPKLSDSLGHLLPNSPCVDAADPNEEDAHIPYGMGTVRADMGAYGGPENWVWGGEPIPTNGEPEIVHIVDIPQDQGKKVGIQFSASLFDNGHSAYDVTHYSFWRELDENGKMPLEASKTPVGQFFQKGPNYWEYVGEIPANGFANYGYSAPTLGDSTVSGMFWSKFLVVAHTNDSDIFWVSQPDSGYSVDNLAPATPLNLAGIVAGVTYNLQWTPSPDEDFQYYAIYRSLNGNMAEEPFATTTEPEFSDITLNLEEQDFAVAAFDFSGNRSPLSSPVAAPVYDLLTLPAGWSGISSWIQPMNPEPGYLFAPASTDLIILQNMQGVYWPGQNVNTLGTWDENEGYMVKMAHEAQIPFIGTKNPENDFQLTSGWQILPVLSNCPLPVEELQNQLGSNLVIVKEIAGWRIFWPAMGISTLETLEPGKAYFLNTLTGNGQVVFGECE